MYMLTYLPNADTSLEPINNANIVEPNYYHYNALRQKSLEDKIEVAVQITK